MPTVAEVMNDVADACRASRPSAWTSATTLTYRDLKRYLRQTVDELLDRVDWPDPITLDTTITGTDAETYDLPAAFNRMARDEFAVYETTTTRRAVIPVTSNSDWTFLEDVGSSGGDRFYRVTGDENAGFDISFFRSLETGATVIASFVTKNWLSLGGTPDSTWTDEAATLLLPRDLVEMGCVWRFRRDKGLPFADRMAEYEARLARRANDKRGRQKVCFGDQPARSWTDIPVPDIIPTA
jgi:hypothetical protein